MRSGQPRHAAEVPNAVTLAVVQNVRVATAVLKIAYVLPAAGVTVSANTDAVIAVRAALARHSQ